MNDHEIIELLRSGYAVNYAPVSGGVALLKSFEDEDELKPITIAQFLGLKTRGVIEHFDTQSHGHYVFHGRVDRYRLTTNHCAA